MSVHAVEAGRQDHPPLVFGAQSLFPKKCHQKMKSKHMKCGARDVKTNPATYLTSGKWNCTKCGACCKLAYLLTDLANIPDEKLRLMVEPFPKEYLKDNRCIHLTDTNECGIYDTRPKICRVNQDYRSNEELAKDCADVNVITERMGL